MKTEHTPKLVDFWKGDKNYQVPVDLAIAAPDLLEAAKFVLNNYGIPEGKERLAAAIAKAECR